MVSINSIFLSIFLVSSIAVKESAGLVCSVTITFVIKEVFQAHPWPCLLVDQEPLNLPGTCSCFHIAFLVAFWLVVPVIFFFWELLLHSFGLGLLLYKIHILYFYFFYQLFELIAYLSGKTLAHCTFATICNCMQLYF